MKQRYQNDVDMFGVVRNYLTTHAAELTAVPIIANLRTELADKITDIADADAIIVTPTTGVTDDKDEVRTDLEEAAFAVSEPLASLALAITDLTLLGEVGVTRSDLDKMDAAVLDAFAERVVTHATARLAALAPYGVTAGMITAITTARGDFAAVVNSPREAVVERSAQVASVPALVRDVKKRILRGQLDRLMNRYRLTNPTLYNGYRSARVIVDRVGGGGNGGGTQQPAAPTGFAVTQANPGDALEATADADPAATLWEVLERAAGSADEFTLIASGATLPVAFTHGPGDFEFVMRKTTPAGVSALSEPVTFTVA